ncbi:MAG: hypothetical protein WAW80_02215 [Candidatus Saccharimonadales bacterium]
MYIAILGRQPAIGMAELERVFGNVYWFSHDSALIESDKFDIQKLGGIIKAGHVVSKLSTSDWRKTSMEIVRLYSEKWNETTGKMTLGISVYGFKVSPRDVQRTGLILKSNLKKNGVSLRLIPNDQAILGTATSHHNKLGLAPNKVELIVIKGHSGKVIIAESTGSQNITSLARRDQERPARDAFVGMLPPKLALTMLNLAGSKPKMHILDPFCGTGVIPQEALLLDYTVSGSDLNPKMVDYTLRNLDWLKQRYDSGNMQLIRQGDAIEYEWIEASEIDAVVCETYLGQPFSAPPALEKLDQVRRNCDHIITEFLKNIGRQIKPGTSLCLAIPAWNDGNDNFTHLPLIKKVDQLGYRPIEFKNVHAKDLLYYRPEQIVARELLVLEKI